MSQDLSKLKRNRMSDGLIGQETINQVEHIRPAGAKLVMSGILVPGDILTTDISAAPVYVKIGSILRIEVTATTYVAFGDDQLAAVTSSTSPALKLASGTYLVVATDEFIRASANPSRIEIISG